MATTIRGIIWVDAAGRTRLTTPRAGASLAGIQAALLAKSNAGVLYEWEGVQSAGAGAAAAATFPSILDAAMLLFEDAGCDQVRLMLPAPKASIFLADGVTVDPAQITAITTACLGTLQTAAGAPVTAYLGGLRASRNRSP